MVPTITTEHVSALADVFIALAAGFAAWQGVKGLNAWRQERIGTRHIELAEETLIQFYEIENAFNAIRSPMSSSSETEGREPPAHESPAEKRGRENAFVVFNRMQQHQETFSKFYATSLKVKALLGEDAYKPFAEIRKCFGEVRVAAMMLHDTPYGGYIDQEFQQNLDRTIWNVGSADENSVEQKVKFAVESAEGSLSKFLKAH